VRLRSGVRVGLQKTLINQPGVSIRKMFNKLRPGPKLLDPTGSIFATWDLFSGILLSDFLSISQSLEAKKVSKAFSRRRSMHQLTSLLALIRYVIISRKDETLLEYLRSFQAKNHFPLWSYGKSFCKTLR